MAQDATVRGVHDGQPVFRRGPDPAAARLTVVLIHGRGGSAASMLTLAEEIGGNDFAVHVRGLDFPAHDPRAYYANAVAYATSARGACASRSTAATAWAGTRSNTS